MHIRACGAAPRPSPSPLQPRHRKTNTEPPLFWARWQVVGQRWAATDLAGFGEGPRGRGPGAAPRTPLAVGRRGFWFIGGVFVSVDLPGSVCKGCALGGDVCDLRLGGSSTTPAKVGGRKNTDALRRPSFGPASVVTTIHYKIPPSPAEHFTTPSPADKSGRRPCRRCETQVSQRRRGRRVDLSPRCWAGFGTFPSRWAELVSRISLVRRRADGGTLPPGGPQGDRLHRAASRIWTASRASGMLT